MDNIGFGGYFLYLVSLFSMHFTLISLHLVLFLIFPKIVSYKLCYNLCGNNYSVKFHIQTHIISAVHVILHNTTDFLDLKYRAIQSKEYRLNDS